MISAFMTIKSPTEALEHISPLDGHHSALLAVFSVQHPLRISQAASSGCWGGGHLELGFDPGHTSYLLF